MESLPLARMFLFTWHMFHGWSVSRITQQQQQQKNTELLFTEFGWKMGLSPEQTSLTSGMDPNERIQESFLRSFINFSGNNAGN